MSPVAIAKANISGVVSPNFCLNSSPESVAATKVCRIAKKGADKPTSLPREANAPVLKEKASSILRFSKSCFNWSSSLRSWSRLNIFPGSSIPNSALAALAVQLFFKQK